jgi:ABC-type transport system involved in multi-copper enzyme maturation permease subunit
MKMGRFGLGPVFAYEWLRSSRRWQLYATRSLFIAILFAALCLTWISEIGWNSYNASMRRNAVVGEHIFFAVIGTQLALVLLLAPAATANAICLDKARGSLVHLLVTDLSGVELVLGKLAARLIPVLGMVACSLPMLFLCLHFGGIEPDALIGAFLVILGVAVLCSTFALAISVWGRQTQDVLLAAYLVWGVLLLAAPGWNALTTLWPGLSPLPAGFEYTNPFYLAFAPYLRRIHLPISEYLTFLVVCLTVSLVLVVVAVWKIRAVTIGQLGVPDARSRRKRWPRLAPQGGTAALDFNPVYWQERRRRPSGRWARNIWRIYGMLALLFSLAAVLSYWNGSGASLAAWCSGLQVSIGLLLFGVTLVSGIAHERINGSLEVLLTTPLSTWTIVWGKWLASLRSLFPFLLLPLLVTVCMGLGKGAWFAILIFVCLTVSYGGALIGLGLLLATWIRRPGQAIAILVTLYVSITVGWLLIIMEILQHSVATDGMAMASPFYGPGDLTYEISEGHNNLPSITAWGIGWAAVYSGMAGFLLMLTKTGHFESRLGRAAVRLQASTVPLQLRSTEGVAAHPQRPPP